ncbi:MAG TPA: MoxR family ATPase [Chloroflexota bacterium]|nr:MoxR family ATPase [Chloroflexota bacterium]
MSSFSRAAGSRDVRAAAADVDLFRATTASIEREVGKVIVGQEAVLRGALIALFAGGHVLLEGVPGLAKTRMVRAIAEALDLDYARIQFTPDLMPADITGTNIISEDGSGERRFRFEPGPVFANLLLADEINRATPKTQAALLEGMAEFQVTVANTQHRLPAPFMVLATQNPIEMEGTYPLPEAQLDRFLLKIHVRYPSARELVEILNRTTSGSEAKIERAASASEILRMQALVREVPIADHVQEYAARLVMSTHPNEPGAPKVTRDYVRFGASPRGAIAIVLAAKVNALIEGRYNVAYEDIRYVAPAALRHRVILNFEADAEGVTTDTIIEELVMSVTPEEAELAVR